MPPCPELLLPTLIVCLAAILWPDKRPHTWRESVFWLRRICLRLAVLFVGMTISVFPFFLTFAFKVQYPVNLIVSGGFLVIMLITTFCAVQGWLSARLLWLHIKMADADASIARRKYYGRSIPHHLIRQRVRNLLVWRRSRLWDKWLGKLGGCSAYDIFLKDLRDQKQKTAF